MQQVSNRLNLRQAEWRYAALKVTWKLRLLALAIKAYDPGQPRVPAGNPDGGHWTSTGASNIGPANVDDFYDRDFQPSPTRGEEYDVAVIDSPQQYVVNIAEEEHTPFKKGGHTITEHVGKTEGELIRRMDQNRKIKQVGPFSERYDFEEAVGTFENVARASELINTVLQNNKEFVDAVASGAMGTDGRAVQMRFGRITGLEAYRTHFSANVSFRYAYSVRVVIRYAPDRKRGYNVLTAFPTNGSLKGRPFMPIGE